MKDLINKNAEIVTKSLKNIFSYKDKNILSVDIEFPKIKLFKNYPVQMRINSHYRHIINKIYCYASIKLYHYAIEQYENSIKNHYPFNQHELVMRYAVSLNENCTLSTYFDRYEYTGGAHGITPRTSETFSLITGKKMKLKDYFINNENYKELIISKLQKQAQENLSLYPGIYFNDYKDLIVKNFNEDNFYLSSEVINFYYQQYDIGPYATGLVVFNVAYEDLNISKPSCIK